MFSVRISRRTVVVAAAVGVPAVAAGVWLMSSPTAQPARSAASTAPATATATTAAVVATAPADWGTVATSLPTDRTVLIVAPKTESGANRILSVNHETSVVDFTREQPDTKYDLISGGQVWMGLNRIGPAEDGNYQIVTGRDTEGGNVDCVSVNSAGQFSEENCEEVERPGELIVGGRDCFHFEQHGNEWNIEAFGGYLEAREREAGVTEDRNPPPAQKFTVVVAP
jgi:hypothetical protein